MKGKRLLLPLIFLLIMAFGCPAVLSDDAGGAWDITGNGTVDEVDAYLYDLYQDGTISSREALDGLSAYFTGSLLGEKYYDRFCYTGEESGDGYYRNGYVSVTLTEGWREFERGSAHYYLADVYIRDLSCLRTAFAEPSYRRYMEDTCLGMAKRVDAVIAVSGDYCAGRSAGPVLRNGAWYRQSVDREREVGVLFMDGTLKTYQSTHFSLKDAKEQDIWQIWNFGPGLLDENGNMRTKFQSDVTGQNPRSCIGYYEPGHYCLVMVEGRGVNGSKGLSMAELSRFFYDLGCKAAYNFDGGATAIMVDAAHEISTQSKKRGCSDIIYIAKAPSEKTGAE